MKFSHLLFKSHLEEDEKIFEILHRHPYVYFRDSFKVLFFGVLIPVAGYFVFPQLIFIFFVWAVIGLIGMMYHFLDWYFDVWIITDLGVIDIEVNGMFDKNAKRVEYTAIDALGYKINGIMATILNFGDVTIDTMGTHMSLILKEAPHPKSIEKLVVKYQEKSVEDSSFHDHEALKDMLAGMIAYHAKNNKIEKKR